MIHHTGLHCWGPLNLLGQAAEERASQIQQGIMGDGDTQPEMKKKGGGGVSPQQTSRERRQFCFCIYYILDQDMKQKLKQKKTCIYKRMNGK